MVPEILYDRLMNRRYTPCQALKKREKLSYSERQTCYKLALEPGMECCVFQIDGEVICGSSVDKCDGVVLVKDKKGIWTEVFVELKGSDISHAIRQLRATLLHETFCNTVCHTRKARVVTGQRIPANTGNSIIERAKVDFKKMKCDFRAIKSNQPDFLRLT